MKRKAARSMREAKAARKAFTSAPHPAEHAHAQEMLATLRREYAALQEEFRNERRLRSEESSRHELFRAAFERAPVGLCLLDGEGRIVEVNAVLERMFRLRGQEMRGRLLADFVEGGGDRLRAALLEAPVGDSPRSAAREWRFRVGRGSFNARVDFSLASGRRDRMLYRAVLSRTPGRARRGKHADVTLRWKDLQSRLQKLAVGGASGDRVAAECARAAWSALGVAAVTVWRRERAGLFRLVAGYPEWIARRIGGGGASFLEKIASRDVKTLRFDGARNGPAWLPAGVAYLAGVGFGEAAKPVAGVVSAFGKPAVAAPVRDQILSSVAELLASVDARLGVERELAEAEARFRGLVETTPAVTYVTAAKTRARLVYVSPRVESILGFTQAELMAAPSLLAKRMHPEDRRRVEEAYKGCVKAAADFKAEYRMVARDGRTVWFLDEAVPVRDEEGRIAYFQGFMADVTARKRAEGALAETTALLEKVFSTTHIGIAYLARDFTYVRVNRAYAGADGHDPAFYVGKNYFELHAARGRRAIFRNVRSTGKPYFARAHESVRPGGGAQYWDWSLQPVVEQGGEVGGLVLSVLDVSERKRAEEELRRSERRFRSLVELLPVGISVVQDGKVVFRNAADKAILGPLADTAEFGGLLDIHPEDREVFARFRGRAAESSAGEPSAEFRFLHPGGDEEGTRTRWLFCRSEPIEYRGAAAALVCTLDVSRVRELERLAAVRERVDSFGQISAGMAHEIRNPLSGINIYVSAVEQIVGASPGLETEERAKLAAIVEQLRFASAKISSVIQRIMEFAKPVPPKLDLVDVNNAIRGALRSTAVLVRKRRVRIRRSLHRELPRCHVDPALLEQVLVNLVTNAVQAMDGAGNERRVEVASTVRNNSVLIDVSDSGPGVPAHLRGRIFDPFFTTRKEGYGIGLSFSHRVIADHGGSLTVKTSRWGGGLFQIALPIAGAAD